HSRPVGFAVDCGAAALGTAKPQPATGPLRRFSREIAGLREILVGMRPERVPAQTLGLAVAALLGWAAASGTAAAAESVFTVGNYPVEARADNAVAAKDRALSEGQEAALRSLLRRLTPVTALARLRQLANLRAGDLIEGVKVRAERNSATDYIANLDFSF